MIISAALLCVAGLVNTGPDAYQIDYYVHHNGEVITIRDVSKRDVLFFTENFPTCNALTPIWFPSPKTV